MIKLIVFDLDDTLYNEFQFVQNGFKAVAEYLSHKYLIDSKELQSKMLNILNEYGRGKIFNVLCEKCGFIEAMNDLVFIYRNAKCKLNLYDDAYYILEKLRYNYKLGLITDGKASVQWNKIKCLGVENYFDKIIVTDDFGRMYWKPHEYSYKKMLEYFKCEPQEAIYVGDNPTKDFIGARKVGFFTVRIIREFGDNMKLKEEKGYEADFTINNLKELINIIQLLHLKK
ncbi:HAD family hydrolase [Clostridium guangxiense]|uniref:HAD family hydrolase n=1 Tax=Clostridium guangxiense TaxID=1662055 RepID=UPI001E592919|nr:HAD-IA family hydrolase [Clostridium guangxiense]MCD2345252.1 HAD-IA family hydrolase [Clostridium guangxiense]